MRFQASLGLAAAAAVLLCLWPGSAGAGGRLPMLSYRGGGQGKVVFDHQLHASQGFHCNDCHTDFAGTGKQLFTTRKQGLIAMADHTSGTKCFACHNGHAVTGERKSAFNDCGRCHRKIGGF
jgi:c(7)-type cytochrome triheme protein